MRLVIPKFYSNHETLLTHLRQHYQNVENRLVEITQLTTADLVELLKASGETVTHIGRTPVTVVMASDTNDNAYDTKTGTLVYKTVDGVEKTAVATFNASDSTTEVAFVPAVTDFYEPVSFTLNVAVQTGDNVYVGTTGMVADADLRYCTVTAGNTASTDAQLAGVGSIKIACKTDAAGARNSTGTLVYWNGAGVLKTAVYALGANASTAVYPTIDSVRVKDFYRLYELKQDSGVAADEILILNNIATPDAVYGVIPASSCCSETSEYMAETNKHTYLVFIDANYPAADLVCQLQYILTPVDQTQFTDTHNFALTADVGFHIPFELEPNTTVTFNVKKVVASNFDNVHVNFLYVVAW